ncbi:uncharacterized protein LOC129238538 [Anastrepha obliqua]|uniref:uncharacterized protein LOC129238538 n=1 Tax=Anastrepha obliqua TaxID=95512 RepID=UPI002409F85B|nr:uncharacterized protein LOC129238538 [Anastrepha obliqua]
MPCLTCTICAEVYKTSDVVYTTTCGHVFHFACMQQWRSRSTSCPQCREHNPETHRIYLDFDETANDQKLSEIKFQLDQTEKSRSELQLQLDEVERDFLQIQRTLVETEQQKMCLESTNQFLNAQNDSREQEIRNSNLRALEESELLLVKTTSLEHRLKGVLVELELKTEECFKLSEANSKLRKTLERNEQIYENARKQYEAVERGLKTQITAQIELIERKNNIIGELTDNERQEIESRKKQATTNNEYKSSEILMQKLKLERELEKSFDKTMELEENHLRSKEILNIEIESLKADIERKDNEIKNRKAEHMKLINKLSSMGSNATDILLRRRNEVLSTKLEETRCELEKAIQSSAEKDIVVQKLKQNESLLLTKLDKLAEQGQTKEPVEHEAKSYEKTSGASNECQAKANEGTSVTIRGVSESDIKTPLIDTVLMFTEMMAIPCQNSDIKDIFTLNNKYKMRNNTQSENINLVVKFSTLNMKIKFLANKDKLKPKGIHVLEYVDDEIKELFHYAKLLRSVGFQNIYCKNNKVFAKYNSKSPARKLNSKQEVNDIIKKSSCHKTEKSGNISEESQEKCENKSEEGNKRMEGIQAEECDDAYYRK